MTTDKTTSRYQSPFNTWDERASVRAAPRRLADNSGDRLYFSPDLVPVTRHHLVKNLPVPAYRALLVQHLYRYLDFTAKLESLAVNPVVLGIAHGTAGIDLPESMRFDAYRIYCDEAYHTLFSADLSRQVQEATRVDPVLPGRPLFLRRLSEFREELPADYRELLGLMFVVVSETLISSTLAEVPDSPEVVSAVRETVADHAVDEGRHHAFFASFLKYLWTQLPAADRHRVSLWIPRLMDTFLRPDLAAIREELARHGLDDEDAGAVVSDIYTFEAMSEHRSGVTRMTLRYFTELDAFRSWQAQEELAVYGFQEEL